MGEERQEFNFLEIVDLMKDITKDGRELKYEKGEIGITTLISCPKKYELKQKYGLPEVDSLVIEDGFLFEKVFKTALRRKFGPKFKEELELPYKVLDLRIRGHLDCAVDLGDTMVGVELKHTLVQNAPNLKREPPKIIVLNPEEPEIKINPKYILQSRIERYLLSKLYPDKKIEHYLFIKTTLKGAWRYYKSYLVMPTVNDMSDEEFLEYVRWFKEKDEPMDPVECAFCYFREIGVCEGVKPKAENENGVKEEVDKRVFHLLRRLDELNMEKEAVIKELKTFLKGKVVEWQGKKVGQITYTGYTYNNPALVKLLKERGYRAIDFFQVKPSKIKVLEELLGGDIELARKPVEQKKKWIGLD